MLFPIFSRTPNVRILRQPNKRNSLPLNVVLHHGNALYLNPNTRNGGNKCIHDLDDRRVRQDTSHNRPIQQIDQCWHVEEEYHKTDYALRSSINSHKILKIVR